MVGAKMSNIVNDLLHIQRCLAFISLIALATAFVHADEPLRPDAGKKIRVFLFAGQSNMEGRANGLELTEADRRRLLAAQGRVQLAYNHRPPAPLDIVEPPSDIREIYHVDRIFGPELFFGIEMAETWPDEKFLFVKRTAGATTLYGAWNPDWTAEKAALVEDKDESELYKDLVAYTKELLSSYKPDEVELCAMLWVQGESDGKKELSATTYGRNLRTLIERIRTDLGRDALPFLLLQVGSEKVVEGMKQTALALSQVILLPQSQDPASPEFLHKIENGHYNYHGMKRMSSRFAEAYLKEFTQSSGR